METTAPIEASIWRKLAETFLCGLLPATCFWLAQELRPDWQSGKVAAYTGLFLGEAGTFVFLPLLVLSALAFLAMVWFPRTAECRTLRFFVATGPVLALQYGLVVALYLFADSYGVPTALALGILGGSLSVLLPRLAYRGFRWIRHRYGRLGALGAAILAALAVLGVAFWVDRDEPGAVLLIAVVVGSLFSAPFWTLAIYWMRIRAWRDPGMRWAWWLSATAWLVAWAGLWRLAIERVLAEYSALPTEPPDCFLATVAARGHAGFVGSATASASGRTFPVTPQLRRFKAFEVLLIRFLPWIHRPLRRVYDAVGPKLAAQVSRPWSADATWLLLKPIEMTAAMLIWLAGPRAKQQVERIWPRSE